MPAPLRIAVIGVDHWYAAAPFAKAAAARPDAELVAVVDRTLWRAEEIARQAGITRATTDVESVLADDSVAAIACFTSVDQSPDVCIAAAEAGKHIVAVKPVAMTLFDADRVVAAVERTGVVYVPSEARRSSPLAQLLSSWVHGGVLGELRAGTFTMHTSRPQSWRGASDSGWWIDRGRTPGGGWLDHAVYQIDRMRWLFGSEVAFVTGTVGNLAYPELAVEDYGHAVFTLESGAVVTVEDTWLAQPGAMTERAHLTGTAGALYYDVAAKSLGRAVGRDSWATHPLPPDSFDTLDVLIDAVRTGIAPAASARSARETLAVATRFYASATRVE